MKLDQTKSGYAAITSMLVVTAVLVMVGTGVSLLSIGNAQMSLGATQASGAHTLAESCIEEALLKLNLNSSIPTSVTTPQGTCTITLDSQSGTTYTFSVTAAQNNRTKKITVSASRTNAVGVISWQEIN